ncbi:MAG: hypothetical protein ABSG04_09310 [Verrucomicrobiota bacterium]
MSENRGQQCNAQVKTWQSTQYASIVRHIPSGIYYARLRVKGKLIWPSLKTDQLPIAKLRHGDFEKEEPKKAEAGYVQAANRILLKHCIQAYRQKGFRPVKPRIQAGARYNNPALGIMRESEHGKQLLLSESQ